jgi:hypothetical protein
MMADHRVSGTDADRHQDISHDGSSGFGDNAYPKLPWTRLFTFAALLVFAAVTLAWWGFLIGVVDLACDLGDRHVRALIGSRCLRGVNAGAASPTGQQVEDVIYNMVRARQGRSNRLPTNEDGA